jgi:hypothetical protein
MSDRLLCQDPRTLLQRSVSIFEGSNHVRVGDSQCSGHQATDEIVGRSALAPSRLRIPLDPSVEDRRYVVGISQCACLHQPGQCGLNVHPPALGLPERS